MLAATGRIRVNLASTTTDAVHWYRMRRLLFAARETLESALKDHGQPAWQRYERHRSSWTAEQVASLLGRVLSPDILEKEVSWTEGEDRYEMDVLVVIDWIANTVEVKAGAFTEPGRRAVPGRLQRDLQNLVGKAHEQAGRAVDAITKSVRLRDRKGDVIAVDTDRIPSVVPIVVTLDELVVVAPQLWALTRAGSSTEDHRPRRWPLRTSNSSSTC